MEVGGKSSSGTDDAVQMREVIAELQRAFAHMKLGYHGVVDLSRFVGKQDKHF